MIFLEREVVENGKGCKRQQRHRLNRKMGAENDRTYRVGHGSVSLEVFGARKRTGSSSATSVYLRNSEIAERERRWSYGARRLVFIGV